MQTVLVVEDNRDMLEAVTAALQRDGFRVRAALSAELAKDMIFEDEKIDIGVLDINLPGESGIELTKYLRDIGITAPLIAITARDALSDRIEGLDSGFTDYLVKPFDINELKARVKAQLRQVGGGNEPETIKTPNFSIRPKAFELKKKGKEIALTKIEFRIMQKLMENNTVMVPIDDLIEFAWGEQSDLINPPIRIHIANLRKKIGDTDFSLVKTIPGTGYKLSDV